MKLNLRLTERYKFRGAMSRSIGGRPAKFSVLALLFSGTLCFAAANGLTDTTENIHLGLVGTYRISNLSVLAGKVDYIYAAATSQGVPPVGIYLDGYLTYDRDDSNKSLSWFQSNHSNWIVYGCDQNTVSYEFGNPNVPIDITNSAVRTYQMQEAASEFAQVPAGFTYNGMAWDNVVTLNWNARCGVKEPAWRALYSGSYIDSTYENSITNWAASIYGMMQSQFPGKGVTMNLSTGPTGYSSPAYEIISPLFPYVDIVVDERGFSAYGGGPIKDADWENEVTNLEQLNQMHKAFFLPTEWNNVPNDASISHAQINWTLANYLLVKGQHSYVNMYPLWQGTQGYGNFYDRPEYHAAIGHATSARYAYQGIQRRDYSSGIALVNPSGSLSYTVTLPGTYSDLWGNRMSSITLAPATGAVLLGTSSGSGGTMQLGPVSPNSGSGTSQTFTVTISHPSGYSAVNSVDVMVNSTLTNGTNTCWVLYYRPANELLLSYDNTPTTGAWQPPAVVGTSASQQNSQCSLNIGTAHVSGSGNTLTIQLPITFKSAWSGAKTIYVYAYDTSGTSVGYTAEGSWSVP